MVWDKEATSIQFRQGHFPLGARMAGIIRWVPSLVLTRKFQSDQLRLHCWEMLKLQLSQVVSLGLLMWGWLSTGDSILGLLFFFNIAYLPLLSQKISFPTCIYSITVMVCHFLGFLSYSIQTSLWITRSLLIYIIIVYHHHFLVVLSQLCILPQCTTKPREIGLIFILSVLLNLEFQQFYFYFLPGETIKFTQKASILQRFISKPEVNIFSCT